MFQLHFISMKNAILVMATAIAMLFATSAFAEEKPTPDEGACAYKPSSYITGPFSGAAATGKGLKVTGFYTLKRGITGKIMLGSKLGGASAAGTIGIIKSTGGIIAYTASVLMSPVVIIGGAVIATGIGGFEAYCYFTEDSEEEITE